MAARAEDAPALKRRYAAVREFTLTLAAPLSAEDCCVQSMPDASPVKWHLAHTSWFFETFVLERFEPGFAPFHPAFRMLFNSYYQGVGPMHPRPRRGLVTRPSLGEILDYRRAVDARMHVLLERPVPEAVPLIELGLNHEQQHQELILTDVKHLLAQNPLRPAYRGPREESPPRAAQSGWRRFDGGTAGVGHHGAAFRFDNETPRHLVHLEAYELATRLVTNAEYALFIEDGGYREPRLWLADGWDWACANAVSRPLYWLDGGDEFTLGGPGERDPHAPVVHVSYYEADAYARWANARLPTEAEWERAAVAEPVAGHFADSGRFHPRPADDAGLAQLYGDAWEWTQSAYAGYPGFRPAAGAVGEYNGKFMVNQYVLRGGSCATPPGHIRPTYRNFFPAAARWQFSGIRLARDAGWRPPPGPPRSGDNLSHRAPERRSPMNAVPQPEHDAVLLRTDAGGVVTLTLNRPNQFNSLSEELLAALQAELDAIAANADARAVVIAGAGKAFCAGHDLKQMRANHSHDYMQKLFKQCGRVMTTIVRMPQPVIARVHGIATAAGCQLVAACDLAVAADVARFAVSGINVGLFCSTPAVALSRNMGRKQAMEMLLTGDFIDAAEAQRRGLVNRVVPPDALDAEIGKLTDSIVAKSAVAISMGKQLFYRQLEMGLDGAYQLASETMACNMMSEDAASGIDAFMQKRAPVWKHR